MIFEDHFLPEDISEAEEAFNQLINSLQLIDIYAKRQDELNASLEANKLTNALSQLNNLAIRKNEAKPIYFHELISKPQRWFPH